MTDSQAALIAAAIFGTGIQSNEELFRLAEKFEAWLIEGAG